MILAHPGHVVATAAVGTVALRVILLVGAAVLTGTAVASRRLWTLPLLSVPVLGVVAGTSGWFRISVAVHVAAAAVWLGCVLRVAAARRSERGRIKAAVGPLAVTSAVAVAVSGLAQAWADRVRLDGIAFDRLVLVKAVLLVLATALGAQRSKGWAIASIELTALVAAASVGAALVSVPSAPPAAQAITTPVGTLVPQRPGVNYLHADGAWQRLVLPAGRSTVRLPAGRLLVDTGHGRALQPNGPECASVLLVDPTLADCPDAALAVEDGEALRVLVGWLRHRGVTRLGVLGDGTVRSRAAGRLLGPGRSDPQALVLTGTWESAAASLDHLHGHVPPYGVFLAPWLLQPDLLTRYASTAPLLVLPFDPTGPDALRFAASLPVGESPTASGYRAWGGRTEEPRVWATSPASILPPGLGHEHVDPRRWFPGGALVPISAA